MNTFNLKLVVEINLYEMEHKTAVLIFTATLFNFNFSSVIKLCICFYIWLMRIVWVRSALVHDQLDGHSSREKSNQHLVFYGEVLNRTLPIPLVTNWV